MSNYQQPADPTPAKSIVGTFPVGADSLNLGNDLRVKYTQPDTASGHPQNCPNPSPVAAQGGYGINAQTSGTCSICGLKLVLSGGGRYCQNHGQQ